mmetsp:Transcript_32904/g.42290  ORF Transcript_32904/g.42290 Transcript_32904/m.42290 type:complete len:923 (+) Transcript_32904:59-2827(+)
MASNRSPFVSNHDTSVDKPVRVKGAVGTEKRPPLLVVVGLGKGSEGPRETLGALWPLASLFAIKFCICVFGSNWVIMLRGPTKDGAIYCTDDEGCKLTWLRYQFFCVRVSAIILVTFVFLLEIGLPIVVRVSGSKRHSWFNSYPVRGIVYIFLAVLTQPDTYDIWYSDIIAGFSTFGYIYGGCLVGVMPANFLLTFIPRGYPTSVKTQRPESTFWAVVTLVGCGLNLCGFFAVAFEMFWWNDGANIPTLTYTEVVGTEDATNLGKSLYVYQAYAIRTSLLFFIPLLFAAELEVTPVLHGLPELRYLVTKGPVYLFIGTILLVADDGWTPVDFVNYTAYSYICFGAAYLAFPAVRIIHELFGDRLSPKTRFYPGLYTFFSVWGVVLAICTFVLLLWQSIAYDTGGWTVMERYQWFALKLFGYVTCILAMFTELELESFFEYSLGGVPIHFDFFRNWISRALLYLFIACMCAFGGDLKDSGVVTLFDLDRALMWTWVIYACIYVVFFIHLVSSAMLYKLYIANEAWFQKAIADESVSETTGLLVGDEEIGVGSTAWSQANSAGGMVNRHKNKSSDNVNGGLGQTKKSTTEEGMRRFVLQKSGKLVLSPMRFTEEKGGALGKLTGPKKSKKKQAAAADGGDIKEDGDEDDEDEQEEVKLPQNFYVRGILYDGVGKCRSVNAVDPEKTKKGRPLPKGKKAKQQQLNAHAAYLAQLEGKRIFCWGTSDTIPLVVSSEVSRMGKEAAIDVQVWCRAPVKSAWALAGAEDVQVGEARVALDQLSLGVPGVVQLHAPNSNASGDSRGTLELTISYEPPSDDENDNSENDHNSDDSDIGSENNKNDKKNKNKSNSSSSMVGSKLNVSNGNPSSSTISGGNETTSDSYESAIDPTSGRKYYFNRATGHRTWNKPVDNSKLSANDKTLENAAL